VPVGYRAWSGSFLSSVCLMVGLTGCGSSLPGAGSTAAPSPVPTGPSAPVTSPAAGEAPSTPKEAAEKWLHSIGARDFAGACRLYNPQGRMFTALGGAAACAARLAKAHPAAADGLVRAVVDASAISTQADTAVIPLHAVTIDGANWSHNLDGTFMTLVSSGGTWYIRDYADAVLVTSPK